MRLGDYADGEWMFITTCGAALRFDAVEIDQRTRHRRRATWVPIELPGLGSGANKYAS